MLKNNKGITLVALVITIVVMLILAGITISIVVGDNGLFHRAKEAGQAYNAAMAQEAQDLDTLGTTTVNALVANGLAD